MIVGIFKVQIMVYNDLKIQHPTGLITFVKLNFINPTAISIED